jgi:DNA-binding MarR family transcriptional regulator
MGTETEICLSFLVRQAWLTMRAAVEDALAEHGLSVAQYATMLVLDEHPGASISDVARAVASTRQSANELVTGMQRAGLVERRPHPQDRRSQEIRLTPSGRERLAAARPVVHAAEMALEGDLGGDTRAEARAWLTRIAEARPAVS